MANNKRKSAAPLIALVAALGLSLIAAPALAADPIYPTGSRVGLVPPAGMVKSDKFDGFADPNEEAAILINVLPAAAYSQIEKTVDPEAAKKQGVHIDKREPITLSAGKGVLLSGWQMAEGSRFRKYLLLLAADDLTVLLTIQVPDQDAKYSDKDVRDALATLAVRAKVPESEELTLLPFEVGDLAGFQIDGVLRGRALILSDPLPAGSNDGGKDHADSNTRAHFLIAAVPGGPSDPADRGNFAEAFLRRNRRYQERPSDHVRATARRRTIRLSDHGGCPRRPQRSGRQSRAMAALWRRRISADDRDCTGRFMGCRSRAAADGARQHRTEVTSGGGLRIVAWIGSVVVRRRRAGGLFLAAF